jgi:cell division protein FtsZ
VAIMGAAVAEGEERALRAAQLALESPLLNDNNIQGARHVLVNVVSGTTEITMDEFEEINEYIQKSAGSTADVIFGNGVDEELGEKVSVTVIATGFKSNSNMGLVKKAPPERVVRSWDQGETQTTDNVNKIVQAITLENRLNEITHKEETQQPVKAEEPDDLGFILKKKPLEEPSQEAQANFEFEVRKAPVDENNEITFDEEAIRNKTQNLRVGKTILPQQDNLEEQFQRARERIMRLKATNNMNDLEKVPAYVRRNVDLDNVPNSAESQISRYTLGEDSEKRPEIRPNNPFLHDNVD